MSNLKTLCIGLSPCLLCMHQYQRNTFENPVKSSHKRYLPKKGFFHFFQFSNPEAKIHLSNKQEKYDLNEKQKNWFIKKFKSNFLFVFQRIKETHKNKRKEYIREYIKFLIWKKNYDELKFMVMLVVWLILFNLFEMETIFFFVEILGKKWIFYWNFGWDFKWHFCMILDYLGDCVRFRFVWIWHKVFLMICR